MYWYNTVVYSSNCCPITVVILEINVNVNVYIRETPKLSEKKCLEPPYNQVNVKYECIIREKPKPNEKILRNLLIIRYSYSTK